VSWAVRELQAALTQEGITSKLYPRLDTAPAADRRIIVARGNIGTGREILLGSNVFLPASPEALCLIRSISKAGPRCSPPGATRVDSSAPSPN